MVERYRDYVVRKYIRARNAAEAIELERGYPVCEVNEMQDKPNTQNEQNTHAVGFKVIDVDMA
jgi:hypothetical protein